LPTIPKGFHTLTPRIVVNDPKRAADLYHRAFGCEVMGFSFGPDGRAMHAQVRIGDSFLMLSDHPEWNSLSPTTTKALPDFSYGVISKTTPQPP
jgi:PhnB protein